MAYNDDNRTDGLDRNFYQDEFGERITRADDIDPNADSYLVDDDDETMLDTSGHETTPEDPRGFHERLDDTANYDPRQAGDMTSTDSGLDQADRNAVQDRPTDLGREDDTTGPTNRF